MGSTGKLLKRSLVSAAIIMVPIADVTWAEDEVVVWVSNPRPRWEIAIGTHSWPALADLEVASDGSFDEIGFNLNFGVHVPVSRIGRSELLAGVDLGLLSNESNIRFTSDTLVARNGYITPSIKWMFGRGHRFSIDAGAGYYLQDVAEVAGEYPAYFETQLWEEGSFGGYVGGTLDFGSAQPGKNHGVMLNFKVHFVEFGRVRDEAGFYRTTLGQDAGDLSGPIYAAQIGYRWR